MLELLRVSVVTLLENRLFPRSQETIEMDIRLAVICHDGDRPSILTAIYMDSTETNNLKLGITLSLQIREVYGWPDIQV